MTTRDPTFGAAVPLRTGGALIATGAFMSLTTNHIGNVSLRFRQHPGHGSDGLPQGRLFVAPDELVLLDIRAGYDGTVGSEVCILRPDLWTAMFVVNVYQFEN